MFRFTVVFLFTAWCAWAQDDHSQHTAPPAKEDPHAGHVMPGQPAESANSPSAFLLRQSSGTAFQPAAWPMPMYMNRIGNWDLMWMGQGFAVATQQGGPRGGDKIYSANWGMLGAAHSLGKGAVLLRGMVSLDPATITNRSYPLLFQTGESAFGRPLVDAQHPHEFLMELSVQYARPVGEKGMWNIYYAPVGDAAFGPVAFPHRASAMETPQAALSHHWQDSTHIANNVATVGFSWDKLRLEASGFHGAEPNENRWNIDMGAMDSWSARLSVFPTSRWMAQVSGGRITRPEQFHPDDVVRLTASVHHAIPRPNGNSIATSLVWARNYKTIDRRATQAFLAETVVPIGIRNFVTGRFEWSQRDELFDDDHERAHQIEESTGKHAFNVSSFTAGYTREFPLLRHVRSGAGFNATAYAIDPVLKPFYGEHPWGVSVFLRFRLNQSR